MGAVAVDPIVAFLGVVLVGVRVGVGGRHVAYQIAGLAGYAALVVIGVRPVGDVTGFQRQVGVVVGHVAVVVVGVALGVEQVRVVGLVGQQIAVRVVGVGVGLAQAAVRRDVAVLVIGVGAGVTVVGVGFGVVGQRAGGVVLQGGRAAGQLVVIHDLRRQRDGNAGQGFQPGGLCARVRAEAGGGGQVGLRGVGVAHVHIEVRAGQVDVGVFGAQFVNNIGQVRRSGGAVAQLHIRLCAAPIGGFAAVVHPDGAAEHGNGLGVVAFGQVFFTHR